MTFLLSLAGLALMIWAPFYKVKLWRNTPPSKVHDPEGYKLWYQQWHDLPGERRRTKLTIFGFGFFLLILASAINRGI
jgi:hypothetical protein